MEINGYLQAPAVSPPEEKPLVSIGQDIGWAPEPVWTLRWLSYAVKGDANENVLSNTGVHVTLKCVPSNNWTNGSVWGGHVKQPLFPQVSVTDGVTVPQLGQLDRHYNLHILSVRGSIDVAFAFKYLNHWYDNCRRVFKARVPRDVLEYRGNDVQNKWGTS
jgi:hypothetical protein